MKRASYKVDLRALHSLCEANYARLLRLFPDYESSNSRQFELSGARVLLEVVERSRYTTLFLLRAMGPASSSEASLPAVVEDTALWLLPMRMEVRAYHDAAMLEVVNFQHHKAAQGRYPYPNPAMHQQDEKAQQNAFLADWLSHCLHHGQADMGALAQINLRPGRETA